LIGERVFHVLVENKRILTNFDIIRDAPGKNTPMVVSVPSTFFVTDSTINIDFVEITGNPQINGIEVIYIGPPMSLPTAPSTQVSAPVKTPTNLPSPSTTGNVIYRINCGSADQIVVSPNKIVWSPDYYSTFGKTYNTCGNTTSIYCTSRYFRTTDTTPHQYNLPITESNRLYTVRLHFAEQV
jgi:Malectin domain